MMNTENTSNIEITEQKESPNNLKEISIAFDLIGAQTQSSSFLDLDKISESDSIAENISKIVKKTLFDLLKTDPQKLNLALSNNSEVDFVEALSHYQENDPTIRKNIYLSVDQSLKQKSWKKSYLKILVRTGTLAEKSLDFDIARKYFKEALKLNTDNDTRVAINLAYANCYAREGKLDAAIQMYKA